MERVVVLEGINDVLNHIVTTSASLTQADAASLRLFNMKTGQPDMRAGFGLSEKFLGQPSPALDEGIVGSVVHNCDIFCSTEVSNDPRYQQRDLARQEGVCAILSVPLKSGDSAVLAEKNFSSYFRKPANQAP